MLPPISRRPVIRNEAASEYPIQNIALVYRAQYYYDSSPWL